jgi:hypothetical protein
MAADGRITKVFLLSIRIRNRIGPPAYSGYPANGPPAPCPLPRRRDRAAARHPNGCLHVVEYSGHGVSPLAEEASSRTGRQTAGGRPARTRRLMGQSARTSATRVRSNAPGRCSTALSRDQHGCGEFPSCYRSQYITAYRTSIGADLFLGAYGRTTEKSW